MTPRSLFPTKLRIQLIALILLLVAYPCAAGFATAGECKWLMLGFAFGATLQLLLQKLLSSDRRRSDRHHFVCWLQGAEAAAKEERN